MGLYGISLTLWTLHQFYHCHITATIGCDGLSALGHFKYISDTINPSLSHFDLISATRWLLRDTKGHFKWRHIKGHQDDDPNAILDIWAAGNIQMDTAAKLHWASTENVLASDRPMRIFGECGELWIDQKKIVMDLKQQIITYLSAQSAISHWEDRFNWDKGTSNKVNWAFLGVATKSAPAPRRLWATKFASGFFACGRMMFRWKKQPTSCCPRCNMDDEGAAHILRCSHPDALNLWNTAIKDLEPWLTALPTSTAMAAGICAKLRQWHSPYPFVPVNSSLPADLRPLFCDQDNFGWDCFIYGFWSDQWSAVQQAYLLSLQSKLTVKRWSSAIILKLWQIAWDMWDHRNAMLHDSEQGRLVVSIHRDISLLYTAGCTHLPRDLHPLFTITLPQLLDSPLGNKQMWLARVRTATERLNRRPLMRSAYYGERVGLRRWLLTG